MIKNSMLALVLLALAPACNLDFHSGLSRDPAPDATPASTHMCGDSVRDPHEMCAFLFFAAVPGGAASARLVDLDQDGHADLVYLAPDHVVIERGIDTVDFGPELAGPTVTATWLAFGDVDHDGVIDLVTASAHEVDVWRGLGGATYDTTPVAHTETQPITGVGVGDTDGVAGDEIVIAGGFGYTILRADLSVLAHEDTGPAFSLSLADVDGDGHLDGLITTRTSGSMQETLFSSPSGVRATSPLEGSSPTGPGGAPQAVITAAAAADLDGDGVRDVILAQSDPADITTFSAPNNYRDSGPGVVAPVSFIDTGDFDGDGRADIVAASVSPPSFAILYGDTGALAGIPRLNDTVALMEAPTALHVDQDVNGDGVADPIFTTDHHIVILVSTAP